MVASIMEVEKIRNEGRIMGGYPFTAVDETGKEYMFDVSKRTGIFR